MSRARHQTRRQIHDKAIGISRVTIDLLLAPEQALRKRQLEINMKRCALAFEVTRFIRLRQNNMNIARLHELVIIAALPLKDEHLSHLHSGLNPYRQHLLMRSELATLTRGARNTRLLPLSCTRRTRTMLDRLHSWGNHHYMLNNSTALARTT
jgi:hypothetical protein